MKLKKSLFPPIPLISKTIVLKVTIQANVELGRISGQLLPRGELDHEATPHLARPSRIYIRSLTSSVADLFALITR